VHRGRPQTSAAAAATRHTRAAHSNRLLCGSRLLLEQLRSSRIRLKREPAHTTQTNLARRCVQVTLHACSLNECCFSTCCRVRVNPYARATASRHLRKRLTAAARCSPLLLSAARARPVPGLRWAAGSMHPGVAKAPSLPLQEQQQRRQHGAAAAAAAAPAMNARQCP
jgi:hypothetical protein